MKFITEAAFYTAEFKYNGINVKVSKVDVNNSSKLVDGNWMSDAVQGNVFIQLRDSNKFTVCELMEIRKLDQYDFYQCIN